MNNHRKLQEIRGTKDLLSKDLYQLKYVQNIAQEISYLYGFIPVDTPIMEFTEVFSRTLGESSDIIMKEMYSFQDKGGENITLRPEFTAAMVRLFISKKLIVPSKLFATGPVFRYERPQRCRQRQFHQINFEFFGADSPIDDVELISMAYHIFDKLQISQKIKLEINSLGDEESISLYKKALVEYLKKHQKDLSEESQKRLIVNPLRILDSKDVNDHEILLKAPSINNFYTKNSRDFFMEVLNGLDILNIPYIINDKLVRGLDYYSHTVFEFTTSFLGAHSTVLAGGRYERLVSLMGGVEVSAIGFAGGIERIISLIDYNYNASRPISLIPIEEEVKERCLQLAYKLRCRGFFIYYHYENNSLKNIFRKANKLNSKLVIIVNNYDLQNNSISIRDMDCKLQEKISIDAIEEYIEHYF